MSESARYIRRFKETGIYDVACLLMYIETAGWRCATFHPLPMSGSKH